MFDFPDDAMQGTSHLKTVNLSRSLHAIVIYQLMYHSIFTRYNVFKVIKCIVINSPMHLYEFISESCTNRMFTFMILFLLIKQSQMRSAVINFNKKNNDMKQII